MIFRPTLRMQSWGFVIGSLLFAIPSIQPIAKAMGSEGANITFFVGSWFFTGAGLIQLILAGSPMVPYRGGKALSAAWTVAFTQTIGTLLFNVSTGYAIHPANVAMEKHLVWTPDATGSVAFLVSGSVAMLAIVRSGDLWTLRTKDSFSTWSNLVGCIAFGLSAIGAFVLNNGATVDSVLANLGTLIGAIGFICASILFLGPRYGAKGDKVDDHPAGPAWK